jgi:carbon storage regulator
MLVLGRKAGESLTIGAEVTIKVIRVNGNQVRLGIEAPDWVKVWRSEVETPLNSSSLLDLPPSQEQPHCPSCRKPR